LLFAISLICEAKVTSEVTTQGYLIVSCDAADNITVTCSGGNVKINGGYPGNDDEDRRLLI
jgi:hypothetical protein